MEKIYNTKCSIKDRKGKRNNFTATPKTQYVVSCVSKMIVQDLQRYSISFKTFKWGVPEQVINSTKQIQAAFIRGFADSEAGVRFRRGHSEVSICSGNINSLMKIREILKDNFEIDTYLGKQQSKAPTIVITRYNSLKRFHDKIGFTIKRKEECLVKSLNSYKRKGINRYPKEFKLKAMNLLKQGLKHREIAKLLGTNHTNIYDWENYLVKEVIRIISNRRT